MSTFDKMVDEIEVIAADLFTAQRAVEGINISTLGGKNIFSKFREDLKMNPMELAAVTTSLVFIASNLFEKTFNQDVAYTLSKGEKYILLALMDETVSGSIMLDRKLSELSGFSEIKDEMNKIFLKISAIVETSEFFKTDIFVQIKRAIPNALSIAIINKDGLPIKVQSTIDGTQLSAFIYALHQLSDIILKKKDYMIVGGDYGSIIIQQIDEERILGLSVPESNDLKLGKYVAKIQEITRDIESGI